MYHLNYAHANTLFQHVLLGEAEQDRGYDNYLLWKANAASSLSTWYMFRHFFVFAVLIPYLKEQVREVFQRITGSETAAPLAGWQAEPCNFQLLMKVKHPSELSVPGDQCLRLGKYMYFPIKSGFFPSLLNKCLSYQIFVNAHHGLVACIYEINEMKDAHIHSTKWVYYLQIVIKG